MDDYLRATLELAIIDAALCETGYPNQPLMICPSTTAGYAVFVSRGFTVPVDVFYRAAILAMGKIRGPDFKVACHLHTDTRRSFLCKSVTVTDAIRGFTCDERPCN
jgi:hypothetical protein